ncbi:Boundary of ROP domain9 [Hibiscus trionum]|uniref:Boundary of ROP domain9 n=1 Tax=Hibiscus trionum TaxID=183268 RepID=A0A9W7J228_HIBTR|nr:Boundary of ROP domain9 [Hibiscus trionum]
MIRKMCPNLDKQDGLETVLEVPIPEEMYTQMGTNAALRWRNLRALMKAQSATFGSVSTTHLQAKSDNEFLALLKIVGAPLIPFQVHLLTCTLSSPLKHFPIESSTAKYIVHQYVAACGGHSALSSTTSMYAVGQVKMRGSEMQPGDDSVQIRGGYEVGGFVLWQKNPDLWYLELVVSGFKVSAGSDGKVAWSQSSSQPGQANRGPPRPLRRFFQGLDPRCTASLFKEAVCIGERRIDEEDCFILKLETASTALKAQSSDQTEIIHHTVWGYFNQRTGLLVKFEDKKLVMMNPSNGSDRVFWETRVKSVVQDYKQIDGIKVAHAGKTMTMMYRYGTSINHKRKIEETWRIDEVDFNITALPNETFLPPADLNRDQQHQ